MCNLILDGCDDFRVEGENASLVLGLEPHLLVMTDGGCRNRGFSAIGYVIYGVIWGYGDFDYYVLTMGGTKILGNRSSFELEALALDTALSLCVQYLGDR